MSTLLPTLHKEHYEETCEGEASWSSLVTNFQFEGFYSLFADWFFPKLVPIPLWARKSETNLRQFFLRI